MAVKTSGSEGYDIGNQAGTNRVVNSFKPPIADVQKSRARANIKSPMSTQGMSWSDYVNAASTNDYEGYDRAQMLQRAGIPTLASQALASKVTGGSNDGGSGGGGGGAAGPSAYEVQSAKDRARLEALYNAYAAQIAGNEASINANYGTAATTLGGIYGGAAAATNAGYDAARAAQTEQLKALGITGGAPSESFGAQLASAGRYTNLGTASQALTEAQRQAAIAGNQSIVGSIRGEQRGALSDFDRMTQENVAAQQQAAASAAAANEAAQARAQAQNAKDAQYWDYKWATLDQEARIAADNAARADRELSLKYPQ